MRPTFLFSFWTLVTAVLLCVMALPGYAATYYVSPDGNDSNPGTEAMPWRDIAKAASKLHEHDKLYLRGGQYAVNDVIVFQKAYVTVEAYGSEEPIIDGKFNAPLGSVEEALYKSLIRVLANNITIDGLTVLNSRGNGISLEHTHHSTAKNCTVKYANNTTIKLGYPGKEGYNTADACVAMFGNYARDNGDLKQWSNIGQVIQLKGSYNTVKNCIVAYGPCAGIEGYRDSDSIVENNIVFGNRLTQIHFARSKNAIIRHNLIYGTERPGVKESNGYGVGIELMCELWYPGSEWDYGHKAYGNMIANTVLGLSIGWQSGKNTNYSENKIKDISVYNNTVIEPSDVLQKNHLCHALSITDHGHLGAGNIVQNNIFWQTNGTPAFGSGNSSKVKMGYNLWNKEPPSSFQCSTDPTYSTSYPILDMAAYFPKTSGWNTLTENSLTGKEFNLLSTAEYAIGKGTNTPVASADEKMLNLANHAIPENNYTFALAAQSKYSSWEVGAAVFVPEEDAGQEDTDIAAPVLQVIK